MTASHKRRLAAAALTSLLAACSSAARSGEGSLSGPLVITSRPVIQPDSATIARARADSVRRPYTAADIDFMSKMISHHAQAIAMARMAPTHDASRTLRTLADRIISAQQDEIATMQQWLADRRLPVPAPRPTGMRMTMNGVEHDMLMPGMLTDAQMRQLEEARGPEFDRLFLTFMIQHHGGAVQMVQQLFSSYGAGQDETVFKFASDVNVDQTTEIARMQKMLADLSPSQRNQP
jgi:uncharacterized protein (DUF305 family)